MPHAVALTLRVSFRYEGGLCPPYPCWDTCIMLPPPPPHSSLSSPLGALLRLPPFTNPSQRIRERAGRLIGFKRARKGARQAREAALHVAAAQTRGSGDV